MPKLDLAYSEVLQGNLEIRGLNLLLTFQVNCPGCFIYALPVAQVLFKNYPPDELNVIGMTTAFEDFQYNTTQNARKLLESGYVVGETKKALNASGFETYPHKIEFPVITDKLMSSAQFLKEMPIDSLINANPSFASMPQPQKAEIKLQMEQYFSRSEFLPYTFTVNNFAGTPTWVFFDADYNILAQWFGHKSQEEIEWIFNSIKSRQVAVD